MPKSPFIIFWQRPNTCGEKNQHNLRNASKLLEISLKEANASNGLPYASEFINKVYVSHFKILGESAHKK